MAGQSQSLFDIFQISLLQLYSLLYCDNLRTVSAVRLVHVMSLDLCMYIMSPYVYNFLSMLSDAMHCFGTLLHV